MPSRWEVEVKVTMNGPLLTPSAVRMKSATLRGSETDQYLKNSTVQVKTNMSQQVSQALQSMGAPLNKREHWWEIKDCLKTHSTTAITSVFHILADRVSYIFSTC